MGELGALFNPGMRHELEERQAKAARREEEGNAKDGDLRIDLESGVAVINASDAQRSPATATEPALPADDHAAGDARSAADDSAITDAATTQASTGQAADHQDSAEDEPEADSGGDRIPATGAKAAPASQTTRSTPSSAKPAEQLRPRGKRGVSATR